MNLRRTGNTDSDANFERMVTEWANEALFDIWNGEGLEFNPSWWFLQVSFTFPTVADQMTYDLPSDIDGRKVFSLRQKVDDVKLQFVDQRVLDEFAPDPDDQSGGGNPFQYTIYGRDGTTKNPYIRLFPIPSSVITMFLRYLRTMDTYDNADGSSTVILPSKYDSTLIKGILSKWYEFDPERGSAQSKLAEFIEGIKKADQDNKVIDEDLVAQSHGFGGRRTLGFVSPAGSGSVD